MTQKETEKALNTAIAHLRAKQRELGYPAPEIDINGEDENDPYDVPSVKELLGEEYWAGHED